MGRRSHAAVRDTETARSAARQAYLTDQEAKTRVARMLAESKRDFGVQAVLARLDRADAEDRARVEARLAARPPPLDLGEP